MFIDCMEETLSSISILGVIENGIWISAVQVLGKTYKCQVQQDHSQETVHEQDQQATCFHCQAGMLFNFIAELDFLYRLVK